MRSTPTKPWSRSRSRSKSPTLPTLSIPDRLKPGEMCYRNPDGELVYIPAAFIMKQAMETLAVQGLRPIFMGTGFAHEQVPRPSDPVTLGSFVQVNFRPRDPRPDEEEVPPNQPPRDGGVAEESDSDNKATHAAEIADKRDDKSS